MKIAIPTPKISNTALNCYASSSPSPNCLDEAVNSQARKALPDATRSLAVAGTRILTPPNVLSLMASARMRQRVTVDILCVDLSVRPSVNIGS